MNGNDVVDALLLIVIGLLGVALIWQLWINATVRNRADEAEGALAEQKLAVSGLLNWAVIRLGESHPEIDPICRAIEKAVQTGCPLEAEKLGHKLDEIKHGRARR